VWLWESILYIAWVILRMIEIGECLNEIFGRQRFSECEIARVQAMKPVQLSAANESSNSQSGSDASARTYTKLLLVCA
jgi:hypothetical protein